MPHTQDFDHPVVQSGRRAIRKEAERGRPDINCLCHEDASTIPSGEHPCRRDSGPVRCELSMLRSLVLSELASEADLGKFLRPTQMAHRRRSIPNIGAASAVLRVGPTHRSIEHAIGRMESRCDRRADVRRDFIRLLAVGDPLTPPPPTPAHSNKISAYIDFTSGPRVGRSRPPRRLRSPDGRCGPRSAGAEVEPSPSPLPNDDSAVDEREYPGFARLCSSFPRDGVSRVGLLHNVESLPCSPLQEQHEPLDICGRHGQNLARCSAYDRR